MTTYSDAARLLDMITQSKSTVPDIEVSLAAVDALRQLGVSMRYWTPDSDKKQIYMDVVTSYFKYKKHLEDRQKHADKIIEIITSLYEKVQTINNEFTEGILKQFNDLSDEAMRTFTKNADYELAIKIGLLRINPKVCGNLKSLTHRQLILGSIYYLNRDKANGDWYINLVTDTLKNNNFPDISAALVNVSEMRL